MNNTKIESLMDKYANGTLSQAEIMEIEEIITSDPSFQSKLDMRKDISDSVNIVGNRDLRKMLNKLHSEVIEKGSTSSNKGKVIKMIMAAAAVLLGSMVIYQLGIFNKLNNSSDERSIQYASYYKPDVTTSRSTDETREDFLLPFVSAYTDGDFNKVITIIEPYLENSNNEVKLIASIAALETGDASMAMKLLDKILATEQYYYTDHANWYKALAYLQLGDKENAKHLLLQLSIDTKADHSKEAKELLQNL